MTFRFKVERVADLAIPLFWPDPSDANNTIYSGRWVREITFVRVPDPMRGGVGSLILQLTEPDEIDAFTPGQVVEMELTPS